MSTSQVLMLIIKLAVLHHYHIHRIPTGNHIPNSLNDTENISLADFRVIGYFTTDLDRTAFPWAKFGHVIGGGVFDAAFQQMLQFL